MDYNKAYKIGRGGIVASILILILASAIQLMFLVYVAFIFLLVSGLIEFIYYRCPRCNQALGSRGKKPKHCPECGFKLGKEDHIDYK